MLNCTIPFYQFTQCHLCCFPWSSIFFSQHKQHASIFGVTQIFINLNKYLKQMNSYHLVSSCNNNVINYYPWPIFSLNKNFNVDHSFMLDHFLATMSMHVEMNWFIPHTYGKFIYCLNVFNYSFLLVCLFWPFLFIIFNWIDALWLVQHGLVFVLKFAILLDPNHALNFFCLLLNIC